MRPVNQRGGGGHVRAPFIDPLDQSMLQGFCLGYKHGEVARFAGYASKYALFNRLKKLFDISGMDNVTSLIAWCFEHGYLKAPITRGFHSQEAANRSYRRKLLYMRRTRKKLQAEGRCTMSMACNRPLKTKWRCDYHHELHKEQMRRYKAGLSKKLETPGELNERAARNYYLGTIAARMAGKAS